MKKPLMLMALPLVLALCSTTSFAVTYDFASPGASVLDGQPQGTFVVGSVPLEIQAGLMNAVGEFILGGGGATLAVEPAEGLGVVSTNTNPQTQIDTGIPGWGEGLVFTFDPSFRPTAITLSRFFAGEDVRIFVNGILVGDFSGMEDTCATEPCGLLTIPLEGEISTLGLTPLGALSDDSDFFVASIEGITEGALTSLSPAKVWIGLKNSDAVDLRLDLLAQVYLNETKIGEGQLNNVSSGSSGFNHARLNTIPLTLFAPVEVLPDDALSLTLSVRRTCYGGGHNSGTPRLWYNDGQADSHFGATIADTTSEFFLRSGFALVTTPGLGPKKPIDGPVDNKAACPKRPFTPFGTWSITLPSRATDVW